MGSRRPVFSAGDESAYAVRAHLLAQMQKAKALEFPLHSKTKSSPGCLCILLHPELQTPCWLHRQVLSLVDDDGPAMTPEPIVAEAEKDCNQGHLDMFYSCHFFLRRRDI